MRILNDYVTHSGVYTGLTALVRFISYLRAKSFRTIRAVRVSSLTRLLRTGQRRAG